MRGPGRRLAGGGGGAGAALSHRRLPADMSCRSRLATLNEKLTALERRIEYIEARVSGGARAGPGVGLAGLALAEAAPLPAGHQGRDADIGPGRPAGAPHRPAPGPPPPPLLVLPINRCAPALPALCLPAAGPRDARLPATVLDVQSLPFIPPGSRGSHPGAVTGGDAHPGLLAALGGT